MRQRDAAIVSGNLVRKPGDEALHVLDSRRLACPVLIRPALVLTSEIAAGFAIVRKACGGDVDGMQLRQARVHGVVDLRAIFARKVGQRWVPEDAAVDEGHEIEGRADHALVFAERERARSWIDHAFESLKHAELALVYMYHLQELARRFATQHVTSAR